MRITTLFVALAVAAVMTSCEDGIIDNISYAVNITNNTDMTLEIEESVDGGDFFRIDTIEPGKNSREKNFIIDTDYELRARDIDSGIIVDELSFNLDDDMDVNWVIE